MKLEIEDFCGNTIQVIEISNVNVADMEEDGIRLQQIDANKPIEFRREIA